MIGLIVALLLSGSRPDPARTPGALNPDVTTSTIATTICVSGWTQTIRPPASYTTKLKQQQMRAWGLRGRTRDYEEDHRVPLAIGGHPTDVRNLWAEPWKGMCNARQKDKLENEIHRRLCRGLISLDSAQSIFLGDWIENYNRTFGTTCLSPTT